MKETGRILREARESQNVSLAAVSAVTKINIKTLEAIENAEMDHLPSKTFLRGFVQTYSNFLKLDPNEVLEIFMKEMGTTKYTPVVEPQPGESPESVTDQQVTVSAPPPPPKSDDKGLAYANGGNTLTSRIIFAVLAGLLIVGIYVASEVVQKYQKESQVAPPPLEVQSNALPEVTSEPVGEATKPEDVKPAEKTTENKPESKTQEPKAAVAEKPPAQAEAKPEPPAAPKPPEPKPPEVKVEPKPPEVAKTPEPPKPAPTPAGEQEVVIEALDTVRVDFRIDGGALQSATLQPEEKKIFKAKREVKIDVSNGGAVTVTHNGKEKGVPGNLGQSMKLSYP